MKKSEIWAALHWFLFILFLPIFDIVLNIVAVALLLLLILLLNLVGGVLVPLLLLVLNVGTVALMLALMLCLPRLISRLYPQP